MGYYETDNYTRPSPAMKRALLETKQRLEAAGHTVWLQDRVLPVSSPPGDLPGICGHSLPGFLALIVLSLVIRTVALWDQCTEG